MKKSLLIILTIILTLSITACGEKKSDSKSGDSDKISVTLNITYPDKSKKENVKKAKVEISKSDNNVLKVLEKYTTDEGIKITIEKDSFVYVSAINGIKGAGSAGWTYDINGELIMEAADKATIKNGDVINWSYKKM